MLDVVLFQALIKCTPDHWGGISDPVPSTVGYPPVWAYCCAVAPHPGVHHPSSPPSPRSHRSVGSIPGRLRPCSHVSHVFTAGWVSSMKVDYPGFDFVRGWGWGDLVTMRSCFCKCFLVWLFCCFSGRLCVHLSSQGGIFSSRACNILRRTLKQRCKRARGGGGILRGLYQGCCVFFLSALCSFTLAPGVIYWTVSESAAACSKKQPQSGRRKAEDSVWNLVFLSCASSTGCHTRSSDSVTPICKPH